MAHNPSVQRTAPIAIAPKPPRKDVTSQRRGSQQRFEIGPNSLQGGASVESGTVVGSAASSCQACRYAGAQCVLSDDEDSCVSCQNNGTDCSFVSSSLASPQARKRRANGTRILDPAFGKKRYALLCWICDRLYVFFLYLFRCANFASLTVACKNT